MLKTRTTAWAMGVLAFAAGAANAGPGATTTNIPLEYNFNGIVHFGESGVPDAPSGFRGISDRALDFQFGVPSDPVLDRYSLVADPGVLDIVHLGNRDTVDNGNHTFELSVPGADPNVGIQPDWLTNVDQTGSQLTHLPTPILLDDASFVSVIFQVSNGGGDFDVRLTFDNGPDLVATLTGPDWFAPNNGTPAIGEFFGTQDVDTANPGANLLITEGFIDVGAYAGASLTAISFENRSNPIAGYAILAANVVVNGRGACCLGNGTCQDALSVGDCEALGGAFQGVDSSCALTLCPVRWDEALDGGADAPENGIETAQRVTGTAAALPTITGTLAPGGTGGGDNDVYLIQITDFENFSASTIGGATFDTMLFLFNEDGSGQVWNDDFGGVLQSTITNQGVFGNGVYALAITAFSSDPRDDANELLFGFDVYPGPDAAQRQPVTATPYATWEGDPDTGDYTITLTGASFLDGPPQPACPCDWNQDTFLNAQDFFDWANDYFSLSGPQGQFDYNEDGFQNAQDFFDFVNCYFAPPSGC